MRKASSAQIIQDNLQYDGSRVGEQLVRVEMKTGARAGQTLEMTSSSGYLFGAGCTEGMKVIVMQSVSGDSTVASVYAQDRETVIYVFAGLYLLVLCLVGGKQGVKGALGLVCSPFSASCSCICRLSTATIPRSGCRCPTCPRCATIVPPCT